MVLRILGEVLLGFLAAGIVMAIAVPAAMQFGYEPGPWLAWIAVAVSVVVCVAVGERLNRRRKPRESS
jgi:membrane protein implicated in regulation of membrane protease activity